MDNNFKTTKIDFLHNIDKSISINSTEKFYYIKIYEWNIENIEQFLNCIKHDETLILFPFVSITCLLKDPYLRLSEYFLVTNKSNPELISKFLDEQWYNSDFSIEGDKRGILYFKIKKVTIESHSF
jgi:hypothetical protein